MLEVNGIKAIKKIMWQDIQPGMILLGGVKINNQVPVELQGFPVLTSTLVTTIREQYCLLQQREIVVAECLPGINARQLSLTLRRYYELIKKINLFRKEFLRQKQQLLTPLGMDADLPVLNSRLIRREYLVSDTYNSIDLPTAAKIVVWPVPSYLNHLQQTLTTGDLLTNKIRARFNLPDDHEILLHLVVDYSTPMQQAGCLAPALAALDFFTRYLVEFLSSIKLKFYGFTTECRPFNTPPGSREFRQGQACFAAFIKKVLHWKNKEVYNHVILFTACQPADEEETFKLARLFKVNKIDYTQVIFPAAGKQAHRQRIMSLAIRLAEACHGSQVLLDHNPLAGIVAVECFDRYLGLISLAERIKSGEDPTLRQPVKQATAYKQKQQGEKFIFPDGKVKKVEKYQDWYKRKK